MRCCKRQYCSLCLITFGLALTVSMVVCVLVGAFDKVINDEIKSTVKKKVELKEGSETFKNWKSPSSQVYMQYFMFNLTNPSDVQNGSRPSVTQLGPYSYREIRRNVPRYFNHSIHTLAYYSEKAYVFDKATSCADCDPMVDKVYTINTLLLKVSQLIGKALNLTSPAIRLLIGPMVNKFLQHEKVFPARSVHELLWGYEDYILLFIDNFTMALNEQLHKQGFNFNVSLISPVVKLQTNNSNTSAEIHTGVGDINRIGQYVSYNHLRTLPWWNTKWANMINGTDATMFHPDLSKGGKLQTFVSDVCRSLYLQYKSTTDVRGITLYKYYTPPELFTYTPDVRAGFCVPNNLTCVPDGLLDISVCQPMNVPIVVSLPHFLFANESVIKSVDGMHPNEDVHATFVSVEPYTGITMKASKRIQINVAVDKVAGINQLEHIRKVYLPVLFVNESAVISKADAEKFKKEVLLPKQIVDIAKYVLIAVGCLFMLAGLILLGFKKKGVSNTEPLVQSHNPNNEDDVSPLISPNYVT